MGQATLLPNGEQQFFDDNGDPLAGGSVTFYIPATTTPKTTWQDADETTPNTNPVVLDAAGRAIIYGSGSYRQVVKDSLGNTIWDQLTMGSPLINTTQGSIASNATTDLGSTGTNNVIVTGNTTITNFGASASLQSPLYFVTFTGTTRITSSSSIIVPGGHDVVTRPNSFAIMQFLGSSTWEIMGFWFPDGTTLSWTGQEVSVPSAATIDLGVQLTNLVRVTGNTGPITSFGNTASLTNPVYVLSFASTPTITNSANIVCPGGSDLSMAAGDALFVQFLGSGVWRVLGRFSASSGGGGGSAGPSIVADSRNNKWVFASNTTLTATVDEVVAKTALGGTAYLGTSLSKTLNFGSTGVNGLDTGAIAASTFYGLYWIYNPGSNTWATLASLNLTTPTSLPSGYTAYALVGVVPTNGSSQIVPGFNIRGRTHWFQPIAISTSLTQQASLTSQSVSAAVPSVAVSCSGILGSANTGLFNGANLIVASDSGATGLQMLDAQGGAGTAGTLTLAFAFAFCNLLLITASTIYYQATVTATYKLYITGFSI